MTKKNQAAYTASEKLLAETIIVALNDLLEAYREIKDAGLDHTEDRNLKTVAIGVKAALSAQNITLDALQAIIEGPQAAHIERLPAWNGYPDEPNTAIGGEEVQ